MKKQRISFNRYVLFNNNCKTDANFQQKKQEQPVSTERVNPFVIRQKEKLEKKFITFYDKIIMSNEKDPLYPNPIKNKTINFDDKPRINFLQPENQRKYAKAINTYLTHIQEQQPRIIYNNQLSPDKMTILQKLLEKYNIKYLEKNHYQKLINSFGLRIQSLKSQKDSRKDKSRTLYQKPFTSLHDRQFTKTKTIFTEEMELTCQKISKQIKMLNQLKDKSNDRTLTKLRVWQKQRRSSTDKFGKTIEQKYESRRRNGKQIDYSQYRLKKYKQFLFVINISNHIYRDLEIIQYKSPLKYFLGKGNNSNLIKSIFKKRFWWSEGNSHRDCNFIWTQIKIEEVFQSQKSYVRHIPYIQSQIHESVLVIENKQKLGKYRQPFDPLLKIMNSYDYLIYQKYREIVDRRRKEQKYTHKLKYINKKLQTQSSEFKIIHNHLPMNGILGNKKAMFFFLKQYYTLLKDEVFSIVPQTYHVQNGLNDEQFKLFMESYNKRKRNKIPNVWIIKPGEFTNRGNGIRCSRRLEQIKKILTENLSIIKGQKRTYIIQSYITRPFLYNNRKFDIRTYMMVTINNGLLKAYWYQQGYIRTSSSFFNLDQLDDPLVHLTNDAIQKHGQQYGRFEPGNKLTYYQLQRYIDSLGIKMDFYATIYPEMKRIATDAIKSSSLFLDEQRKQNNFQIFGLDFMIDDNFKTWLIQINTNPCLELSCGVLQRIIPNMVENAFRIAVDPIFPPPTLHGSSKKYAVSQNALAHNKFELIFDEIRDGRVISKLYQNNQILHNIGMIPEQNDLYQNEGEIIQIIQ